MSTQPDPYTSLAAEWRETADYLERVRNPLIGEMARTLRWTADLLEREGR